MIFEFYGVNACWSVIKKSYNFVYRFEFVKGGASGGDEFIIPQMGTDELVLIFIGSSIVGLILVDEILQMFSAPVLEARGLWRDRSKKQAK